MSISQDVMFEKCESLGEESVREHLNANLWSDMRKRAHAKEWLRKLEDERTEKLLEIQEARELELVDAAKEANKHAEESNSIAREANKLAKTANRRALIASFLALVALLIHALTWLNP